MAGVRLDHLAEYLSWSVESWVPPRLSVPGVEHLVQLGGAGTDRVPEFAVCEVAARLGLSQQAASGLCADVLDLRFRLPRTAAGVRSGLLEWGRARLIARRTRELSPEQAGLVEASVMAPMDTADGRVPRASLVPWGRLVTILDQAILRARGPENVAEAEARVAQSLFVELYRSEDGATDLAARLAAADAARLDARLDQVAGWLAQVGDDRPKPVLRAVALGLLADPAMLKALAGMRKGHPSSDGSGGAALGPCAGVEGEPHRRGRAVPGSPSTARLALESAEPFVDADPEALDDPDLAGEAGVPDGAGPPRERPAGVAGLPAPVLEKLAGLRSTVLYVHLDRASGTWSGEGIGALSREQATGMVGHSRVLVRPVLDVAGELTYTGYTVPPLLREQLALLNAGQCCFPGCGRRARLSEADHRDPHPGGRRGWADAEQAATGTTRSSNMQPLCTRHHRAKTHGRWRVLSPARGVWVWTSPGNAAYLVTNGVTTPLNGTARAEAAQNRARVDAANDVPSTEVSADSGDADRTDRPPGSVSTRDEDSGYTHPADLTPEQADVTYGYLDTA